MQEYKPNQQDIAWNVSGMSLFLFAIESVSVRFYGINGCT
jgi:hypothetical protein